jgi:hypothetical protein
MMILLDAVKKVVVEQNKAIDRFTDVEFAMIRNLTGLTDGRNELKRKIERLRKGGLVGPLLGGKGPMKIDDVICPHCGKRHGDK